ncbi:efflux RND transporter permease subunit [Dongia soli]|uniref:Efflux RND transporter permease subunit n=1 Tax=Dongia soli TaxID=600628 RepID=A0ABU5EGD4_9PROT|nr:efflux RND transporter permease subunit [Dongia soli]MDY0885479.1 efflux RND transporter permease subunit [Dongia soli]
MSIIEAAMAGTRQRFRRVLMTALASIFGVLPRVPTPAQAPAAGNRLD